MYSLCYSLDVLLLSVGSPTYDTGVPQIKVLQKVKSGISSIGFLKKTSALRPL